MSSKHPGGARADGYAAPNLTQTTPSFFVLSPVRSVMALLAIAAVVIVSAFAAPQTAKSVGVDNQWSHQYNGDYGKDGDPTVGKVDCQPAKGGPGCIGWADDAANGSSYANVNYTVSAGFSSFFVRNADSSVLNFVNAIGSGVASNNSPYYARPNTGGTVALAGKSLDRALCAVTYTFDKPSAPNNHGCCQQRTITGGEIFLNTQRGFRDNGDTSGNVCEIRTVYNHEFGHSLGLGHTTYSNQTMYGSLTAIYTAQSGDKRGVGCVYNNVGC